MKNRHVIGAVVRLKAGGPKLTIIARKNQGSSTKLLDGDIILTVAWFVGGEFKTAEVLEGAVEVVDASSSAD